MRKVTVEVAALTATVRENRDEHVRLYKEAVEGYQEALVEMLTKRLKEATKKGDLYDDRGKPRSTYLHLPERPASHQGDYDRVLAMLEMSTDDQVELDAENFAQYVMDDWDWKQDFVRMSSSYSKG